MVFSYQRLCVCVILTDTGGCSGVCHRSVKDGASEELNGLLKTVLSEWGHRFQWSSSLSLSLSVCVCVSCHIFLFMQHAAKDTACFLKLLSEYWLMMQTKLQNCVVFLFMWINACMFNSLIDPHWSRRKQIRPFCVIGLPWVCVNYQVFTVIGVMEVQ